MKQLILRGKKEKKKSWINLINSKFQATCLMFESHVSELLRVYLFTTFDLKKNCHPMPVEDLSQTIEKNNLEVFLSVFITFFII